jgi:5-deoxy-glucuronate isomerase
MSVRLHLPAGTAGDGRDQVAVSPALAGWTYAGLRVIELAPGAARTLRTDGFEAAVVPLAGSCVVECEGRRFELAGRDQVFARVSDFAYLPLDAETRLSSQGGGRFALATAVATRRLDPAYGPAEEVPVELRGAGQASRQVNNFLAPGAFPADKLVAVEVLTPDGNWSSYPPHKHDEQCEGEAVLEEIYYFEIGGHQGTPGFGFHGLYTADHEIDLTVTVRDRDVVLIPRGYHGPSVAAPGYPMYYLNVLAGPAEDRTMAFSDDPAHAWVRASWAGQPMDPRLPLCTAEGTSRDAVAVT